MKKTSSLGALDSTSRALELPNYSVQEASRYLQIPETTIRSWCVGGASGSRVRSSPLIVLPDPRRGYLSFTNLAELFVLGALRSQYRLGLSQIRQAVHFVRQHFESPHPLVERRLWTNRRDLFVRGSGAQELINASRFGQLGMHDLLDLHLERIDWDADGLVSRLYPFTRRCGPDLPKLVTIDPRVGFGRPVLSGTGVPTAVIADRFKAGESIDDLADDYGEDRLRIQEAIRCELQLQRAA